MTREEWEALLDHNPLDWEAMRAFSTWLQDEADSPEEAEFQRYLAGQERAPAWCEGVRPEGEGDDGYTKGWGWGWTHAQGWWESGGKDPPAWGVSARAVVDEVLFEGLEQSNGPERSWGADVRAGYPSRREAERALFHSWLKLRPRAGGSQTG